jgi:prophage DNA circulation protein
MSGPILDALNDTLDTVQQSIDALANEVTDVGNGVTREVDDERSVTSSSSFSSSVTTSSTLIASSVGTTSTASINTSSTTSADSRDAQVTRLYDAIFDRAPGSEGLAFWTDALNRGATLDAVADLLMASPEFQGRHGTADDQEFVKLLYHNVLDREADDAGLEFWTSGLQQSAVDRSDVVLAFLEASEQVAKLTLGSNDSLV